MKTIAIKMRAYTGGVSIVNNNNLEKRLFNFTLACLGSLALLYILILGNMITNIVERRSSESTARTLESEVRNLELAYLSMSNDIDLDFSYSLGFKETKATYATRKSLGYGTARDSFGSVNNSQNDL